MQVISHNIVSSLFVAFSLNEWPLVDAELRQWGTGRGGAASLRDVRVHREHPGVPAGRHAEQAGRRDDKGGGAGEPLGGGAKPPEGEEGPPGNPGHQSRPHWIPAGRTLGTILGRFAFYGVLSYTSMGYMF